MHVTGASFPSSFTVQKPRINAEANTTFDRVTLDGGGGDLIIADHLVVSRDKATIKTENIGFISNSVVYSDGHSYEPHEVWNTPGNFHDNKL